MNVVSAARVFVLSSLFWGTLAFGATYVWASRSMAVWAVMAIGMCFIAGRRSRGPGWLLGLTMVLVLVAIAVQLVPLSRSTIAGMDPARHALLIQLNVGYRFNAAVRHPLSVNPALTWWALVFSAISCLWVVGLSRLLSVIGARWLAVGLAWFGLVIALIGIYQNAVYDGRVYGFWIPQVANAGPFGPFINKNHFAGWMLMVLPLTIGLCGSEARRAMAGVGATVRDRVVWFSTERASRLLLLAGTGVVMLLALILTLSRSGILTAIVLTLVSVVGFVVMGRGTRARKLMLTVATLIVVALVVNGVGLDTLIERFQAVGAHDLELREGAWRDAIATARRFPIAGTGLNTYGTAMLALQTYMPDSHFAQAHSDYLQLWAEGGVLLIAPVCLLALALALEIFRRLREPGGPDWLRVGAVVGLIAILMQEAVEFSLQMPANFLLFATLCAIAIHRSPAKTRGRVSAGHR